MRTVIAISTLILVAACTSPAPASPTALPIVTPLPTPDIERTVQARVDATAVIMAGQLATAVAATKPIGTLIAAVNPPAVTRPSPAPRILLTPVADETGIVRFGTGSTKSEAFALTAGNYLVRWSAVSTSTSGCLLGSVLKAVDEPAFREMVANISIRSTESLDGTGSVYNVKAGRYYFDVSTTCDWRMTIAPTS